MIDTMQLLARAPAAIDCTTPYSGDYYGFGVRMGVYFTWLSSYLANVCLQSEVSGTLDTNSFFLLALLISLFRGSVRGDLILVDGLMGMHLSSGFIFSSLSIWGYRSLNYAKEGPKAIHYFGGFGTHCRLILITAISVYGTWFWWGGVNGGLELAEDPDCQEVWTWFFHTWLTRGGIHILYIIMTVSCSVYFTTMCAVALTTLVYRLLSFKKRHLIRFETGYNQAELTFIFKLFRSFSLGWIIFCILMIELTLHKNHMLNTFPTNEIVGSPAQLIPLLIGILSFVRVLFLLYVDRTGRFGEIWRFDANDAGQPRPLNTANALPSEHDHQSPDAPARPAPLKILGISLRGLMAPATLTRRANTQDFNAGMALRAAPGRPWWKRYLVGLLPWLSVYALWREVTARDLESVAEVDKAAGLGEGKGPREVRSSTSPRIS